MGKILWKFSWKFLLKKVENFLNTILMKVALTSTLTAWLRDTVSVIIHSLMLRVLNTLNGRCEARPIRGVSSPVERLVTVCLRVEAQCRASHKKDEFYIRQLFYVCYIPLVPPSCVSPDARGCTLYMTQLGGFVSRQRSFLRKGEN
jgi:hypothetical protein